MNEQCSVWYITRYLEEWYVGRGELGQVDVVDGLEDDAVLLLLQVGQPQLLGRVQHLTAKFFNPLTRGIGQNCPSKV